MSWNDSQKKFHLIADIRDASVEDFDRFRLRGEIAIAYIDRAIFDLTPAQRKSHRLRDARIHTVVPIRITGNSITIHDPLTFRPMRKSIRLFRQAFELLGGRCVVCSSASARTAS